MKVKEYLLSYGYQCRVVNDMGMLGFDISWSNPEAARKEYKELIKIKKAFNEPLFNFEDLIEVK